MAQNMYSRYSHIQGIPFINLLYNNSNEFLPALTKIIHFPAMTPSLALIG